MVQPPLDKVEKFSYKILFTIVTILLIGIVALLRIQQKPSSVLAEWFNDAWMYRQAINISTHSVGETNVYISTSINIGTTSKSQADNGDFRFTTSSGQLLEYYIVSGAGTTNISFHINLDSFPAGAQTIHAYYGNASADNGFGSNDFSTVASSYSIGSLSSEEVGGGPIAWWKFDEGVGTTAFDSSSNLFNSVLGTGNSSPSWVVDSQCLSGKCLSFDGTNDYIKTTTPITLTTSATLSAWIKTNQANSAILGNYNGEVLAGPYFQIVGGKLSFHNGGCCTVTGNITINDDKWHHVVSVSSGSTTTLYVDGKQDNSGSVTFVTSNDTVFYLGSVLSTNIPTYFFEGSMDDVKVFPYARSASQIKQDYTSGISGQSSSHSSVNIGGNSAKGLSDGLIGYWKMDEGVGTSTTDSSGNSNIGTLNTAGWSAGKFGIGTSYGTNSYVDINNSKVFAPLNSQFSASAWVKLNDFSLSNYPTILRLRSDDTQPWFIIFSNQAGFLGLSTGNSANFARIKTDIPTTTLTSGWHHVIVSYDGSGSTDINSFELYFDGQKQTKTAANMYAGHSQATSIGYNSTGNYWNGLIDEVRVYNRTLSPTDVKNLYNYASPPIAYWNFDEGSGTSSKDISGNNRIATFQNGAGFAPGKYGHALSLNIGSSANQYATVGTYNHNYSFTKEAWIYPTDTNQCPETRCSIIAPYLEIRTQLEYYDYSMATQGWHFGGSIPLNKWSHVAVTYDQSKIRLLVNGTQVYTLDVASTNSHSSNHIGAYSTNSRNFRGYIDEVKVYDYARTSEQVIQDMSGDNASPHSNKPIAYYKFDEGSGTVAYNSGIGGSAINGNLGSGSASPSWNNTGKYGKNLSFNASNNNVVRAPVTSSNGLNIRGEISFSTWFKRSTTSGYHTLVDMVDTCSTASTDGYLLRFYNNTMYFYGYIADAGGTDPFELSYVTNGDTASWHHAAVSWDGTTNTNGVKMYLDGKLVSQMTAASTAANMASLAGYNLSLGTLMCNTHSFDGQIDEVKIYNHAISAEDVKSDYNQGSTFNFGSSNQTIGATTNSLDYCPPGDTSYCIPPTAEYKMDEGIGTTAFDSTGNNNHARLYNSPSWQPGKMGKSILLNGSNTYIGATDSSSLRLGSAGTVEVWVNPKTLPTSSWKVLTNHGNWGGGRNFYSIYMNGASSTLRFDVGGSSSYASVSSIPFSKIPVNTWTQLTLSWNSTTIYAYVNGILSGQTANIHTPDTSVPYDLNIGSINGSYTFDGSLDNIRIYNYTRTPAQIAYGYNKGGPVGWWKLDECQGSTINDSSSFNHPGTITIGASGSQSTLGTCGAGTSAAWTNGSSGKMSSSLSLDGIDDFINVGNTIPTIEGASEASVCSWLKYRPSSVTTDGAIVSRYLGSLGGWLLWVDDNAALSGRSDTVSFSIDPGADASGRVEGSTGLVTSGQWDHYCGVFKGGNYIRLYKNGTLNTEQTSSIVSTVDTDNANFYIGRVDNASPRYLDGQVDDVRVYNYALTNTQIKAIYNGGSINFK